MQKLIETRDLYTNFNTFEGVVKALNGVSVVVNEGETYGLVGESGCGKSVTVRSMMRIVQSPGRIVGGKVIIFFRAEDRSRGIDILKRSETYMTSIRGDAISMIFQEASTSLNPVLSIGYQIGESFRFHRRGQMLEDTIRDLEAELSGRLFFLARGWKRMQRTLFRRELAVLRDYEATIDRVDHELYALEEKADRDSTRRKALLNRRRDRLREKSPLAELVKRVPALSYYQRRLDRTVKRHVVELLRSLGVANPDRIVDGFPHELSGGMQQRIVIAIALACHPVLLIADEPTSNLDVTIQAQIIDVVREMQTQYSSGVILITHDLGVIAEIADKVMVMYGGRTVEFGSIDEIFYNGHHPYTWGLLASLPRLDETEKTRLTPIKGQPPNLITLPDGCPFVGRCPHERPECRDNWPELEIVGPGHGVHCWIPVDERKALRAELPYFKEPAA
jgi:peptide/nickel transport system ATP-binding protein